MTKSISNQDNSSELYIKILNILDKGRVKTLQTINENMLLTYWEIGKEIVVSEQSGNLKSGYAQNTLTNLSIKLSNDRGNGYSVDNLERMRLLFINFPISATLSRKLSWSHYVILLKLKNPDEFQFYFELLKSEYRSVRILKSEISSHLFRRQLQGLNIKAVPSTTKIIHNNLNQIIVSDPLVVDFLGFKIEEEYLESELESRIIQNIQRFMLELGKGFAFVSRQQRISMDGRNFRIDLVFYNTVLKCFVLIDLKTKKLTHGDLGQIQMYVNFYDREVITEGDNKTIGIIIAQEKDDTVVKFTLPQDNQQIFTTRYQTFLPTENDFIQWIAGVDFEVEYNDE
jgi:predicted nuclease of restriction endonuclease-like (RecB) superfamily